ncbi:cytidine deaminase [Phaeospirillum tilakii]|uniref:Cytidine deaminase n=1 Tax=Phaeospirillum tilakii TaxID=741673 RepID=A0ABW5CAZ6_9PROT
MDLRRLIEAARAAQGNAYAPYSGFAVGAAIEDENGRIHRGANVENAAYPLGHCAESNAIGAMVVAGGRTIRRILILGGAAACPPCGGCRQRIREFADAETRILLVAGDGGVSDYRIDDLLPDSFGPDLFRPTQG